MNRDHRVLLVSDRARDLDLIRERLEGELTGLRLETVRDETEFWTTLDEGGFDLVLVSAGLDWMSPYEVLQAVRVRGLNSPLILLVSPGEEIAAASAMRAGVSDYVVRAPQDLVRLAPAVIRCMDDARRLARLEMDDDGPRELFDQVPVGLYRTSPDGRILEASPTLSRTLGYDSADHLKSQSADSFYVDPSDRGTMLSLLESQQVVQGFETRFRRRDGTIAWVRLSARAALDKGGRVLHYDGVLEDVTPLVMAEKALRETEEMYLQAQKMEAVGRLAGGVAHDLNNMLTVINGYSALLVSHPEKGGAQSKAVTQIIRAGEKAAGLTRQLLAFSRRQVLQPRVLDLNAVVSDLSGMLQRVIGEDIDMRTSLAADLGAVTGDQGQIEQVLMNLVVNARDAMPRGGRMMLETANIDIDREYAIRRPVVIPGSYVMVSVSDSGCGIEQSVLARIFEPFFTTKEIGKGTGLGLSTVYGIVKQSGGYIWAYSEPGLGTTFKVYLPRAGEEASPVPEAEHIEPAGARGETVLLAEDEGAVRELIREVLSLEGYEILESCDGEAALETAERYEGPIDILVTDLVMPGMGGRELARRLKARRSSIRVLFLSGYTDDAALHHGLMDPGAQFVQKPFNAGDLIRKVREMLSRPAPVECGEPVAQD